jgi:hypothetical protein
MKNMTLAIATASLLVAGSLATATAGNRHGVDRISDDTGVPVATLQQQRTDTGLGYGELETANLLANASGQSFDTIMTKRRAGEGWGKIAHDYGLNLGKVVSSAHRSSQAATHTRSAHATTGKQTGKTTTSGRSGKGSQSNVAPGFGQNHGHGHGP